MREKRSRKSRSQISFIVSLGRPWAGIGWRLSAAREPSLVALLEPLRPRLQHLSRSFLPATTVVCTVRDDVFPAATGRSLCVGLISPTPRLRSSVQLHRHSIPHGHVSIGSPFILVPVPCLFGTIPVAACQPGEAPYSYIRRLLHEIIQHCIAAPDQGIAVNRWVMGWPIIQ